MWRWRREAYSRFLMRRRRAQSTARARMKRARPPRAAPAMTAVREDVVCCEAVEETMVVGIWEDRRGIKKLNLEAGKAVHLRSWASR